MARKSVKVKPKNSRRKRAHSSDQLLLDFSPDEPAIIPFSQARKTVDDCFHAGCQAEEERRFDDAEREYRSAISIAKHNPVLYFNLGNVLYARQCVEEAIESFRQAVRLKPDYCDAWNNLGVLLAEVGELEAACAAHQKAIAANSKCSDAFYNLADALDELGKASEAKVYWRKYLACERKPSEWAEYARTRLTSDE